MMSTLTTRQRDLLHILLDAQTPLGAAELAAQMQLTPRQVNYGLSGLKQWLAGRNIIINATPGVGVTLDCTPEQYDDLADELAGESYFQLILTAEQRQQLLALILLMADEPFILYQLQQLTQVSRTTVLKDLDIIDEWLYEHHLTLERRPNYGVWIKGQEQARRQALTAWLWGETPLGPSLTSMTHTQGLVFPMKDDADLLPIVQKTNQIIGRWETKRIFGHVAYAEAQLDGRFTDDAVLHLALVLAIQTDRVHNNHHLDVNGQTITWLQSLTVWPVAGQIARRLGWKLTSNWPQAEIAGIAMHLLAAPRNERWPGDLEIDDSFSRLVDDLMQHISQAYNLPDLEEDMTLRDGIVTHIIPACLRHRFDLWLPSSLPITNLSEKYIFEHQLAHNLAGIINRHTTVLLPDSDINNLAMLLRAAFIRERPNRIQEVIVVCPSGMATAQLLVARLKARFPRLGTLKVVSLRELKPARLTAVELIITTVPLPANISSQVKVIQVHPLLLPEDIETITQWLA
jgi:mannitol operon transcriptional antiterminator